MPIEQRKGVIRTRGPKSGICNICLADGLLTEDHVPPKGTIKVRQVDLIHITDKLGNGSPHHKGRRHLQSGVAFRSICSTCNNKLLGLSYDPELIRFTNSIGSFLTTTLDLPNLVKISAIPGLIARAVIGHLFAVGLERQERTPILCEMVEFFLDEKLPLPSGVRIYYWLYPYRDQIIIRDAGLLSHFGNTVVTPFWCLKYFPVGFMVTLNEERPGVIKLPDLSSYMINGGCHEVALPLSLSHLPPSDWPEAPNDHSAVFYGEEAYKASPRQKE